MQHWLEETSLSRVAIDFCCFSIAYELRSTTEARPRVHAARVDFFVFGVLLPRPFLYGIDPARRRRKRIAADSYALCESRRQAIQSRGAIQ